MIDQHSAKQSHSFSFTGSEVGLHQFRYDSSSPGTDVGVHLSRDQPSTLYLDELDAFFADEIEQETESTEICFDKFYEEIDGTAAEISPALNCIPTEQTNSNPVKKAVKPKNVKGTQTFKATQGRKLDLSHISKELALFKSCCKLCCYTWINVQIVTFCRAQYILLPCFAKRRTWLARKMDEMSVTPATFSYRVDILSGDRRKACAKAWRFAYGVPEATHKRAVQRRTNYRRNNKKGRGGSCNSNSTFFIVWLQAFANDVGDKLPFGEGSEASIQIRLPFPHKKNGLHSV